MDGAVLDAPQPTYLVFHTKFSVMLCHSANMVSKFSWIQRCRCCPSACSPANVAVCGTVPVRTVGEQSYRIREFRLRFFESGYIFQPPFEVRNNSLGLLPSLPLPKDVPAHSRTRPTLKQMPADGDGCTTNVALSLSNHRMRPYFSASSKESSLFVHSLDYCVVQ
jgi:hypothetical protein